ncbi:MAG: hypothetical protein ACRDLL_12050 [Solirubrobacterales bacterium]
MTTPTLNAERRELLADLRAQLPRLTDQRARERTQRAIERIEWELAPGRGEADLALRRADTEVGDD